MTNKKILTALEIAEEFSLPMKTSPKGNPVIHLEKLIQYGVIPSYSDIEKAYKMEIDSKEQDLFADNLDQILYDKACDKGNTTAHDLTDEQKANVTALQKSANKRLDTGKKHNRKIDPDKKTLKSLLIETLIGAGASNLAEDGQSKFSFDYQGDNYKINLSKTRKPKP